MLPEVNLLPKYERKESILYNIFIIGLIIVILLSALLAYFYFTTDSKLESIEQNVTLLNEEKTILETRLAAANTDDEISLSEVVAYVEEHHVPTSELIDEFITLLPEHAYLSEFIYNYNSVVIETQFETIPASSTYIADLTDSPYLNEVVIDRLETIVNSEADVEMEDINVDKDGIKIIPRYNVEYSMEVDHQALAEEEEK